MTAWSFDHTKAPKDGTPILVYDGFGVFLARYVPPMSYDDFLDIAGDDEGEKEWREYDAKLRADPDEEYDEWVARSIHSDDVIASFQMIAWMRVPAAPSMPIGAKPARRVEVSA